MLMSRRQQRLQVALNAALLRWVEEFMAETEKMIEAEERKAAEVVVAGIEGRAIVRAGMQRERRFIGEIP